MKNSNYFNDMDEKEVTCHNMSLLKKKSIVKTYDKEHLKPVIRASICTGEQVAGFLNIYTGKFEDVMLIKTGMDLEQFKSMYGIDGEIEKIY